MSGSGSDTRAFTTGATMTVEDEPTAEATEPAPAGMTVLGLLGRGGMGEVHRVLDRRLARAVAMKVLRADLAARGQAVARFEDEARITARLQHPGVVPVHELGRLPDGRPYFTMREVRGSTLHDVVERYWAGAPDAWTFRRVAEAFLRVCETVAYVHSEGVVHRDLKPDNIMLGPHGEVLVLDWGIAKRATDTADPAIEPEVTPSRRSAHTVAGSVFGTPAYMSPEQARGEPVDARSDVYALGAILYEIASNRPPYSGPDGRAILAAVRAGPPAPIGHPQRATPEEVAAICERAMARDPGERFADAGELAVAVAQWLDGAHRREQGLAMVARAAEARPEVQRLRAAAAAMRSESDERLAAIPVWAPEEQKLEAWAQADAATRMEQEALLLDLGASESLQAALELAPDLVEAHAALAEKHREEHAAAEAARDALAAARSESKLKKHVRALPAEHPVARRCASWLADEGALSLVTEPAADVRLYRYVERNRRLVPELVGELGTTPLAAVTLRRGSYVAVLSAPGRRPVRYPVAIGREEHWDGVPPGAVEPVPIVLPADLGEDEVAVPAGWFQAGLAGDEVAIPPRRVWCDAFVIDRFPVTNRGWVAFLDALVAQGREEEALRHVPRERAGQGGGGGGMIYGRGPDGRFVLVPDVDGDVWHPDWPVSMVDGHSARAYARWRAERTGLPWRLPLDLEREKAARGVDGRVYPWGDSYDGSWSRGRDSQEGHALPAVVHGFPVDESPYGVRGVAGNVQDWCGEPWRREGNLAEGQARVGSPPTELPEDEAARWVVRGGFWMGVARVARATTRGSYHPSYRGSHLGVRLVRSTP